MSFAAALSAPPGPNVREVPLEVIEPHGWPKDRQLCESAQFYTGTIPGTHYVNREPAASSPSDYNAPHGQQHIAIQRNQQTPFLVDLSTRELAHLAAGRSFTIDNFGPTPGTTVQIACNPAVGVLMYAAGPPAGPYTTMTTAPAPLTGNGESIEFSVYYMRLAGVNNEPDLTGNIAVFIRSSPAGAVFA